MIIKKMKIMAIMWEVTFISNTVYFQTTNKKDLAITAMPVSAKYLTLFRMLIVTPESMITTSLIKFHP
jgi:hypothetical protein